MSDVQQFLEEVTEFENSVKAFNSFGRFEVMMDCFVKWKHAESQKRLAKALEELPKDFNVNMIYIPDSENL